MSVACSYRRRTACALVIGSIALALTGTLPAEAKSRKKDVRPAEDSAAVDLVWPLPPDPPRIRFEGSLRGASDYKKKRGGFRRFLIGPEEDEGISLRKPYGVASDAQGRVYVTDTGLGAVVVFDAAEREVRTLGASGRVKLVTPIGVGVDRSGRIWVSDAELNRVFSFDPAGDVILALGAAEQLENPTGLVIDHTNGRLFVADSKLHKIFLYSLDGAHLGTWGGRGPGEGQFNFPTNLALDSNGNLYVVDTGGFRVQIFRSDGTFLSQFGEAGDGPGTFHRPKGIALDSEGNVYVVDAAFSNFQIFNRQGQLLLSVGTYGDDDGNFWLPAGIHIDGSDRIYVVDQVNKRVQIFQFLASESGKQPGSTGNVRDSPGAQANRATSVHGERPAPSDTASNRPGVSHAKLQSRR